MVMVKIQFFNFIAIDLGAWEEIVCWGSKNIINTSVYEIRFFGYFNSESSQPLHMLWLSPKDEAGRMNMKQQYVTEKSQSINLDKVHWFNG